MKSKANILNQSQYEQLVQLSLIKYFVTQPKELCGLIKLIKKHKALLATCKKIMAINRDLVMLFTQHASSGLWLEILLSNELKQDWQIEARQRYLFLCDKLADVVGIPAKKIEMLHKTRVDLKNLVDFRRACIERSDTDIRESMRSMKTDALYKFCMSELEQHLFPVIKFTPGKSIDQMIDVTTPLLEAIYLGDVKLVKSLVKSRANPCFQPHTTQLSGLHLCLSTLQPQLVRYFSKLDVYKQKFQYMFLDSIFEGKSIFVQFFVDTGFCLDAKKETDYIALRSSLSEHNAEFNAMLLPSCNIKELDADQKVELIKFAACNLDPSVLKQLLDQGIDINMLDAKGHYTALFHLCFFAKVRDAIKNMVKNGANIEFISPRSGSTPLVFASEYGREDSVRTLVELGANIHHRNIVGADALLMCVEHQLEDLAFVLIEKGASIDRVYEKGLTLCYHALQKGCVRLAKYLIKNSKIDFNSQVNGFSYLHAAAVSKQVELIDLMLTKGIDINALNNDGLSPFFSACELGANENALRLIRAGAHVPQQTPRGLNFLSTVFRTCHLSVAQAILEKHSFDINLPDSYGLTAVACALTMVGDDAAINLFSGKQVRHLSQKAYSPLVIAILQGEDRFAQWLVETVKMSADHHCRSGFTPLYAAIYKGNFELVRWLLQQGVPILQINGSAYTPLMQACSDGFDEIVELLIEAGAEVNQVSEVINRTSDNSMSVQLTTLSKHSAVKNDQICALDLAARGNHHQVVELLLRHGAISTSKDSSVKAYIEHMRLISIRHNEYLQQAISTLAQLFESVESVKLGCEAPSPAKIKPVETLSSRILKKLKAGLGNIPKNDLVLIAERLDTASDAVIAKEIEGYRSKRESLVQKIRLVEQALLSDEDADSLQKRMPNTAKLHIATLSTLRGIHQKLCRLNSGIEDSNAPLIADIPILLKTAEQALAPSISYPRGCKLQDFPLLHEVRRGSNIYVAPCLDLLTDGANLTAKAAFERELIAPKIARDNGAGLKGIEGYSCKVDINGESCVLPLGFELKITSSKSRILCYCLQPLGQGPTIVIPAVFKPKGLHSASDKDKTHVYQAPPLAEFLAVARKALVDKAEQEEFSLQVV